MRVSPLLVLYKTSLPAQPGGGAMMEETTRLRGTTASELQRDVPRRIGESGTRLSRRSVSPMNLSRFSVELAYSETMQMIPGSAVEDWTQADVVFVLEQLFAADDYDKRRHRICCARKAAIDGPPKPALFQKSHLGRPIRGDARELTGVPFTRLTAHRRVSTRYSAGWSRGVVEVITESPNAVAPQQPTARRALCTLQATPSLRLQVRAALDWPASAATDR
jgi:hypothetical protein